MAVAIRLQVMGAKNRPFYRIVAIDSRRKRDGKALANLGYYNPLKDPAEVHINEEKLMFYLRCGAQPSDTVRNLLKQKGIKQIRMKTEKGVKKIWTKVDQDAQQNQQQTQSSQ